MTENIDRDFDIAGGTLSHTEDGWELYGTDTTVEGFPEELVKDQAFDSIEDVLGAIAVYRYATYAALPTELTDEIRGAGSVEDLGENFDGLDTLEEAQKFSAAVNRFYETIEDEADVIWGVLSDEVSWEVRTSAAAKGQRIMRGY